MKAKEYYSKRKGGEIKFVPYLRRTLFNTFLNLCEKSKHFVQWNPKYVSYEDLTCEPSFIWELIAFDYSEDAQLVVNTLVKSSARAMKPAPATIKRAFTELGFDCSESLKEIYTKLSRDLNEVKKIIEQTNGKCGRCHFSKKGACYGIDKDRS